MRLKLWLFNYVGMVCKCISLVFWLVKLEHLEHTDEPTEEFDESTNESSSDEEEDESD